MIKRYILLILHVVPCAIYAQYCTSGGPTTTNDSNIESASLTGNGNAISYTGCPAVLGIEDQTAQTVNLMAGSNYTLNVQFGTCGGDYEGTGEAWIDFNQDESFDPSESIGTWSGTPPVSSSAFNFNVPSGSINGTSRLRIMQKEGTTSPLDPCSGFQWGSAVDFSIVIEGGLDCSGYLGDDYNDPIIIGGLPYSNNHNNSICYANNNNAYPSPDVYYLILPSTSTQTLNVSLCGSAFDTFLSVFDTDGNTISFNDDGSCGGQSELSFQVNNHDSLYIIVEGWGNESGDYTIEVTGEFLSTINLKKDNIHIFPNPVQNSFSLKGLVTDQILIYDTRGKMVKLVYNYVGEMIQVNQLTKGVYFVSYLNEDRRITKKIIVN